MAKIKAAMYHLIPSIYPTIQITTVTVVIRTEQMIVINQFLTPCDCSNKNRADDSNKSVSDSMMKIFDSFKDSFTE